MMRIRFLVWAGACLCCWSPVVAAGGDPSGFEVKGSADLQAGKRGKASVVVTAIVFAKPGWHINEKAPLSLAVIPPTGVVVRKKKLGRGDLTVDTPEQARFDVPVSGKTADVASLTVEARFVICKAELCSPQSQRLTIAMNSATGAATSGKTTAAGGPPGR